MGRIRKRVRQFWVNFRLITLQWGWRSFTRWDDGAWTEARFPKGEKWHGPFCADPFLFHYQRANWLFYETTDHDGKGKIGCFKEVGGKWVQQGLVLEQPWHMSYPQVFEENGHVYMIPEESDFGKGELRLYEATDFPRGWVIRQTLIKRPFADATLLRRDGHYYMACYTIPPKETAELWHAESLWGPWTRHPMWNRINQSPRLRRCGGSFIERDGKLYRVAQDCNGYYGKRLFLVEVTAISPAEYQEGEWKLLFDKTMGPRQMKHTYNEICVGGHRLSVVDTHYYNLRPFRDICGKLKRNFVYKLGLLGIRW